MDSIQLLKYPELVDIPKLQALMESFSQVIGIANAVIGIDGVVIVSAGWQTACTDFHRVNSETCWRCIESDTSLVKSVTKGVPFAIYRCLNGLVDTAAPILVAGEHVANVFTGQFLTEAPDFEFFRKQAKEFGFDETRYLEAIAKVPVIPQARVESITRLYAQLAGMLADNGLDRLTQKKAATELVVANKELAQSRDAAEAGNRAKTRFLANMSHELRTPMNGVMGMIDLALRRATDPKQIDILNKSKGAAQRMIKVVNDIIDFSKIEAERLPLEEKNFSLSQMIDDAVAMQDLTAEAKGLTVIREIPATFPDQLSGDAFRLRQILLNFLGNACKFSEQGMITVRVNAVEQDDDSLLARIEVEDQGIGINPEQQAMLFQSFTQADGSMTRKYGGSGLGLIISKRLANLMGGDAGVVSQEGHGSTFWATVRLKYAKASAAGV